MSLPQTYSLNTKITLSFTALGLFLLLILFVQIIPNMKMEQQESKKNQIEHMITVTNEQLKLAVELLIHSRESKHNKIETEINQIIYDNKFDTYKKCEFYSKDEAFKSLNKNELNSLSNMHLSFYTGEEEHMCPKTTKSILYSKILDNGKEIIAKCNPSFFENKYSNLEEDIKNNLQKSFELTEKDHKGKINLIWINTESENYANLPLYEKEDKTYNMKYCLSKMSSSSIPQTGRLTAKEIVEASDSSPIYHLINSKENIEKFDKPAYTWVKTLSNTSGKRLFFLTTIYEEDFNREFNSPLLKVLPATILSFLIVIALGFFLFKKLFKSINVLTTTAKKVNDGNIHLRSNIKGTDDISILAKTFDSMLDSIEKNINQLDKKVEIKTKELRTSLEEKEILLKEIHHRVKNNLAMTINLIKLQKSKIDDEKTKNSLTDIQERIFTMELLHRKLYESKDLNFISFNRYVLELLEDLDGTYGKNKKIKINSDIDDINMNIEYALPCGLIITECIINAYKYAFLNKQGNINISFKIIKNECTLIIGDDGEGLPNGIDINKSKSLGLKLVSTIVRGQLFGEFSHENRDGAIFKISFKYDS